MIDLNMDFKDYYKSLNIGVGATDSAIKKAYKQLAKNITQIVMVAQKKSLKKSKKLTKF